ncbi:MAG: hypothetical protein Q9160_001304 [Pyrenula sp. 1 TL-2023]
MGRVFVGGSGLNRQESWVHTVTQFVEDVFAGGWKLKTYSHFTRPFAARFLVPEIRRVWRAQAAARRELVPIMKSRLLREAGKSPTIDEKGKERKQKPLDLLQWLMHNNIENNNNNSAKSSPTSPLSGRKLRTKTQPARKKKSLSELAELTLVAYLGSTHTTGTTLANLLLDIAARPRDAEALREEVEKSSMDLDGEAAGSTPATKQSLHISRTSKLDSYMKESQRLNPAFLSTLLVSVCFLLFHVFFTHGVPVLIFSPNPVTHSRLTVHPITLSSSLHIPASTHLLTPASEVSLDPDIYPDSPHTFRGFRFSDLRALNSSTDKDNNGAKFQFTATSPQALHFGYGPHACPGRFFASTVIKALVRRILMEFDLKIAGAGDEDEDEEERRERRVGEEGGKGEGKGSGGRRPENDVLGAQVSLARDAEVWVRRRR